MGQKLLRLKGAVQHYAWGGHEYIPNLINVENRDQQPYAELWMGTHHRGEALVELEDGSWIPLSKLFTRQPELLGHSVEAKNGLPFLFKVLDVKEMLSIQSHPNKQQAIKGFQAENDAGIPLTASHRNFKDDNHKPEIMVALTEFWLLHGFKKAEAIYQAINEVQAFEPLKKAFQHKEVIQLYQYVMRLPQQEVNRILRPLQEALQQSDWPKHQPEYWAKKAFESHKREHGDLDRGIFSIFFFNLVKLNPGQGIFQGAGIPHAYLEGVNVELMANSDNVFRGGLTAKHIDVDELLNHLIVDAVTPRVLNGHQLSDVEWEYPAPVSDFKLSRIILAPSKHYSQETITNPQILMLIDGEVDSNGERLKRGDIVLAPAGSHYTLEGVEQAVLYKATF
jgi:mannose-6-phosphate isomerase